jgi:NTP pyrophosphatase (non-canonical NTP hydrolase)
MNISKVNLLKREITNEFIQASQRHKPFNSAHEGYAVLLEEVDEVWDEIKKNNYCNARQEIVQVAAMALRFLYDLDKEMAPQPPEDQTPC